MPTPWLCPTYARARAVWLARGHGLRRVVERERLAGVLGRLIWGTDTSGFYGEIARPAEEPDGTVILDLPCGGRGRVPGLAARTTRALRGGRSLAGDAAARARAEANRRDLDQIEFIDADVEALPFRDASFDLCVSYTGLHCFPDPAAAVSEIACVLRPGGVVRGTTVVKRAGLRQNAFVRLYQVVGVFGPSGTSEELESWLADLGMLDVSTRSDGALAYFSAGNPERA